MMVGVIDSGADAGDNRSGAQAVDRATRILEVFAASEEPLALADVARTTGLHMSTAHRLVRALVRATLLAQDPRTDRYRLGLGCVVLGQSASRQFGLADAEQELDALARATGEDASVGSREGDNVVVVLRASSHQPLRFERPPGTRIGLHASAMGKALLAFGSPDVGTTVAELGALQRYTARTITSKRRLLADLSQAREQGWTLNDEEQHVGVRAIGAPVLDTAGIARLAVAIQGPTARLSDAQLPALADRVVDSARRLATTLSLRQFE